MPDLRKSGWSIEYQQETVGLGPDGRAAEGVKVGYTTGKGLHGSVFIPKDRYNPANVAAQVAAAAAQMDEVHGLTG